MRVLESRLWAVFYVLCVFIGMILEVEDVWIAAAIILGTIYVCVGDILQRLDKLEAR